MKKTELKRIEENTKGEFPEFTKIIITAKNVENAKEVLKKTKEVMKIISSYAYKNEWPSDQMWKTILPAWFVESMTLKTSKDRDNDENQYHFESWIANIKDRAWLWYSSDIKKNDLQFVLETLSTPYLFSTFIYILYCQGIMLDNIIITDDLDK
jgi:hypothetical protein